jgi:hypothetical protein
MTSQGTPAHDRDDLEVVRWYTRARRFPQLIGKTAGGERIWGGPYTMTQVLAVATVGFVGWQTIGLWGHMTGIGNVMVLAGAIIGAGILAGRIPPGVRNPLILVRGAWRALDAPTHGRLTTGRPVTPRRPVRTRTRVLHHDTPALADIPTVRTTSSSPEPMPVTSAALAGRGVREMTNLERLLASGRKGTS